MKHEITNLDSDQIVRYTFDEAHQAQRVVITGDFGIKEALKDMKINILPSSEAQEKEIQVVYVDKPVIIKEQEFREIEKPVIVEKIVFRDVESAPIILKEVEYREIEKPIVVKEYIEAKETKKDKIFYILSLIQSFILIGILLHK